MSETRHRQLSRIYNCPIDSDEDARAAINGDPGILASALFDEAVASDDVISIETAKTYLEDRLKFLGPATSGAADSIRRSFDERVSAWA